MDRDTEWTLFRDPIDHATISQFTPQLIIDNPNKEARIILTIRALKQDSKLKLKRIIRIYNILRIILRDRYYRMISRRDSIANLYILIDLEEDIIIKYIFELDL